MKLQQIQQQKIQQYQVRQNENPELQTTQFKGMAQFLRYLATNQGVGANAVDFCFMVSPRTLSDSIRRGPLAGLETARREMAGLINDTCIGAYGMGVGALAALLFGMKKYTSNANSILAAPETLKILAQNKANQIKNNKSQIDYIKETLGQLKLYNPSLKTADKDGLIKLSDETINEIATFLDKSINSNIKFKDWKKVKNADSIGIAMNKIIGETGAESELLIEATDTTLKGGVIKSKTTLETFLKDMFNVSRAFNEKEVKKAFDEQIKNNVDISKNEFVKKMTRFMKTKSYAGFAIAALIGMSAQPINMYITKKKTGSDGFVGVEGRSKDDSTGFKALKVASGAAFAGIVLLTLGTGLKGFMGKMAFKGYWPTVEQLKGVYGLTIISRLLAARDKDELRESATKDTLGFLSWLVLGNFINKAVATGVESKVINKTAEMDKKNGFMKIFKSSLKTRDEVLVKALKDNNISLMKEDGGKTFAKSFKEMMKDLKTLEPTIQKKVKKQLRTLNGAQLAGYLFSGLVLGFGIPNLNIYITNTLDKKRKAKAAEEQAKQAQLINA